MIGNIQLNLLRLHHQRLITPATKYSVNYKDESQNQYRYHSANVFSVHANPEGYPSADLEKRINEANLSRNFVLLHHHPRFTVDHTQRVSTTGSNQAASSASTWSHGRTHSISKCKAFNFDHLQAFGGVVSKSCVVPVESGSGWKAQAHSWVEKSSGLSCLLWHWRTWRGFRCTGCRRMDTWTKKKKKWGDVRVVEKIGF